MQKQKILQKYENLISKLQNAKKYDKLKQLKNKRFNIAREYDWQIANMIAKISDEALLGIGDTDFRRSMYRGNGMSHFRKRIGRWSYARMNSIPRRNVVNVGQC